MTAIIVGEGSEYNDIQIDEAGISYSDISIPTEDCTPNVIAFCEAVSERIEELKNTIDYLLNNEEEE